MNRGYVRLWRKSLDAGWIKNHKLWAFWTWCILKASHKEFAAIVGLQRVNLLPGQFIFGLKKASQETGLTIREIRTILHFLKKSENLTIKTTNKFSVITIINWHTYQVEETENDNQNDKQRANKWQHTKTKEHKEKKPCDFSSQPSELGKRYPDPDILNQAFKAIALTRKSNRISDSVKLSILQSWEKYPVESVVTGIRTYLEKGYANQGKNEKYLMGIIRNNKPEDKDSSSGQVTKNTGSHLLNELYRSRGHTII